MAAQSSAFRAVVFLCLASVTVSCSTGSSSGEMGSVGLGLAVPPDDFDVASVFFEVVNEDGDTQAQIVPLHPEPLPDTVDPGLGGHRFADWFVVLNPGLYMVRATPLNAASEPSENCEPVTGDAAVIEGATTEIVLVSECVGEDSGGLDTVVVFNRSPFIEELEFDESKFVCTDEAAGMTVTASDPDSDTLTYEWTVTGLPDGATDSSYCLVSDGPRAAFSAIVQGRYELTVAVSDDFGATTQLIFPVYSQTCDGTPDCPGDAAQAIISVPPGTPEGLCVCNGAVCGNGVLEPGEQCDDGNNADGDGCSADCTEEQATLVINEILYDESGADGPTVFTELWGSPGLDLTGYTLVGVNGANGEVYRTITLVGVIPSDGFFVLATTDASAPIASVRDFIANVDWQNGPDAVQLNDENGAQLDALQYGDAGGNNAGEGNPATDVPANSSLSRDAAHTDSNDNASDFAILDFPTPGS